MEIRFDYPEKETPLFALTFPQCAGRLRKDVPGLSLDQDVKDLPDGDVMATQKGVGRNKLPFTARFAMTSATETDLDDVRDWILNVAEGAINAFVFTDSDGTERRVKIVNSDFEFPVFNSNPTDGVILSTVFHFRVLEVLN